MLICKHPRCTTWLHVFIKCKFNDLSQIGLAFTRLKFCTGTYSYSDSMFIRLNELLKKVYSLPVGGIYASAALAAYIEFSCNICSILLLWSFT